MPERVSSHMTFRTRLVLAATVAVAVAVLLAAVVAFFAARSSLLASVDDTLSVEATAALQNPTGVNVGSYGEIGCFAPAGATDQGSCSLPVTARVEAVANGQAKVFFTTVEPTSGPYRGEQYREIVTPAPDADGAILLATPMAGVNSQLRRLGLELAAAAVIGVLLAVLLGWLVGRTALVPLYDLTTSVETLAETTDVTQRLDPSGVDEMGRLRRAFNSLLAALEASRESQRQLVLDASHELRTPLTSLRTNLEVLRRVDELSPGDRDVLINDVLTQLGELTQLVGDLAELARGEQHPQVAERFRLDQLVDDAVTVATTHGRSRQIRIEARMSPNWVDGHPERITRAVGNLLDNAVKWSPEGGLIEVTCHGGTVTVRDHGPGIDPDDLDHVFDRFYRAPAARGKPGSGLGLAIVAQVAREENGQVWAGPADGGGAVFTLRFPVAPPPADDLLRGELMADD
jgi:two-component system sensor histidine kinase MprB